MTIKFSDLNSEVKLAALVAIITGLNESGKLPDSILGAATSRFGIGPQDLADAVNVLGDEGSANFEMFEKFFADENESLPDWFGADQCEWIEPKHHADYIEGQQTLIYDMYAIATVLPHHYYEETLAKQFTEGWVILFPDAIYGLKATTLKESPIYRSQEQAMNAVQEIVYAKFNRDLPH